MTETFRGAILAVPGGQLEAGYAFGMTRWKVFHRILVPQMIRHALPGFGNNWLVLLKTTALVSVIGLDDMVRKAYLAMGATRKPFVFFLAVALGFLIFTTVSVLLLRWAERRYSLGYRRD
jgi:arginine/ornithine transport system permease protein